MIRGAIGLGVFVALLAALAAGPAAARRPTCTANARHARVDAGSRSAVLYDRRGVLYGCWRSSRRVTRLASFTQHCPYGARPGTRSYVAACDQATTFAFPRLAGRYAAFVIGSDDEDAFTSTITVVDLPRGHRLYSRDSLAGSSFPSESVTYYYVRSFALDARGRTAWGHEWFPDGVCSTGCVAPPIGSDNREVHAHDGVGDRLLDSGPDVQVRSVAIHNGAVTWTRAGATESIALR